MSETTIFRAKKIPTMTPRNPTATRVAVRDGRILHAGSLEDSSAWGPHRLDERFADKTLMPGMIEGTVKLHRRPRQERAARRARRPGDGRSQGALRANRREAEAVR